MCFCSFLKTTPLLSDTPVGIAQAWASYTLIRFLATVYYIRVLCLETPDNLGILAVSWHSRVSAYLLRFFEFILLFFLL